MSLEIDQWNEHSERLLKSFVRLAGSEKSNREYLIANIQDGFENVFESELFRNLQCVTRLGLTFKSFSPLMSKNLSTLKELECLDLVVQSEDCHDVVFDFLEHLNIEILHISCFEAQHIPWKFLRNTLLNGKLKTLHIVSYYGFSDKNFHDSSEMNSFLDGIEHSLTLKKFSIAIHDFFDGSSVMSNKLANAITSRKRIIDVGVDAVIRRTNNHDLFLFYNRLLKSDVLKILDMRGVSMHGIDLTKLLELETNIMNTKNLKSASGRIFKRFVKPQMACGLENLSIVETNADIVDILESCPNLTDLEIDCYEFPDKTYDLFKGLSKIHSIIRIAINRVNTLNPPIIISILDSLTRALNQGWRCRSLFIGGIFEIDRFMDSNGWWLSNGINLNMYNDVRSSVITLLAIIKRKKSELQHFHKLPMDICKIIAKMIYATRGEIDTWRYRNQQN